MAPSLKSYNWTKLNSAKILNGSLPVSYLQSLRLRNTDHKSSQWDWNPEANLAQIHRSNTDWVTSPPLFLSVGLTSPWLWYTFSELAHLERKSYGHNARPVSVKSIPFQRHNDVFTVIPRLAKDLREKRAAITIQKCYRGYVCRKQFVSIRKAVVIIQCYTRGMFARRLRKHLLEVTKAKIIQCCWRRYRARKRYRNYKKTVIYLQSCVRRMIARRQLKQLKVGHLTIQSDKTMKRFESERKTSKILTPPQFPVICDFHALYHCLILTRRDFSLRHWLDSSVIEKCATRSFCHGRSLLLFFCLFCSRLVKELRSPLKKGAARLIDHFWYIKIQPGS